MVLVPKGGQFAALYVATGALQTLADAAMTEVNLTTEGRARYTVYELPEATRHLFDDSGMPTFQVNPGGNTSWGTLTPYKIALVAGRIYLSAALGSSDTVRCHAGKYKTPNMVAGCLNYKYNGSWETEKLMFLRDTAKRTVQVAKVWDATAELCMVSQCAELTHEQLVIVHDKGGTAGNSVSVTITNPGGTAALAISLVGAAITIALGTSGGAIVSTYVDIISAMQRNALLSELGVSGHLATGEDGLDVATAMSITSLSGGLDPVDWGAIDGRIIAEFYRDYDTKTRWVAYGMISSDSMDTDPAKAERKTIKFESYGTGSHGDPVLIGG